MNLREKYGEWGVILGATEGVGKAFCEKIAEGGMSVVMVGRREEKLHELAKEIEATYGVQTKVVRADSSQPDAAETVFAATEGLDMGFMSYVACLHSFGKIQDTPWEKHEAMINVNVVTFLKCFHHYMQIFAAQDRGAVINVSSMTGISSSPWNGQYGAGKAFILKMTEAVACECEKTGVDVEVITLGTTLTPSLLRNLPGGSPGRGGHEDCPHAGGVRGRGLREARQGALGHCRRAQQEECPRLEGQPHRGRVHPLHGLVLRRQGLAA